VAQQRVAVVTGASSGIGAAVAARLAAAGFLDAYAGPRGRAFAAMAWFERKAPGPDAVAGKVAAIADDSHPALRNKITKEATQFTLLRWMLPPGAFESGVRRAFRLGAKGKAQPQGSAA
jgi:NAD(P)-dependent dehydrogenase (short-subunit alcohol dehydrogenase family)